ncbi:MAG: bifunctional methylenetetrahydrofolate dehydrogenase/methenyltetrahydrofolate cyclohydrolase [Gammaproteobacteria bacterium]|nr:bifunctional methylenetetrahydrofolate dehydrogenase/methenyltetrahydrofolate cyclohydrolase [Gammaproteobacteria bacterium]MBU1960846.1 bifunctional methylenetetrahydrofolate dehydrogenase/methenyltetrahydrofolate cyclohydrolase [Gammaproteobacteria bacterium]
MGQTPGHVSRLCKTRDLECKKVGNNYLLHESTVKRLPDNEFNPADMANHFHQQLSRVVKRNRYRCKPRILGILAPGAGDAASMVYARTLQKACEVVGFDLGLVQNELSAIEGRIDRANADPSIHGIFVFYPIFKDGRDKSLKDRIHPVKDIEGLSGYWSNKLYLNDRYVDEDKKKKAILPCTSLGILKTLAYVDYLDERPGHTFEGKKITIFNRSDVVGRPLAYMLKNDGATVYSFDVDGGLLMQRNREEASISREEALKQSDIIITGVPSRAFEKVRGEEIKPNTTCLNFSFFQNFEESAKEKAGVYIPRVGPMTIAMCVRNAIRLYENNRDVYEAEGQVEASTFCSYGEVISLAA